MKFNQNVIGILIKNNKYFITIYLDKKYKIKNKNKINININKI